MIHMSLITLRYMKNISRILLHWIQPSRLAASKGDMHDILRISRRKIFLPLFFTAGGRTGKIDAILKAAQAAPTAVDKQPFKIFLAADEKAAAVRDAGRIRFVTPLIMIVGADPDQAWIRKEDGRNFADVDAAIAATHIMMEVQDLGLGTVWVGHFDAQGLKIAYPQMKDLDLLAVFPNRLSKCRCRAF